MVIRPRRHHVFAYLTPVVLVVVAVTQLYLAHTRELSSWKGGGFGMFAAVDGPGERSVQATLVTADGAEWLADIDALERASMRAQVSLFRAAIMPDRRGLDVAARAIRSATWVAGPDEPHLIAVPQRPVPTGAGIATPPELDVVDVSIRVLRLRSDPATAMVSTEVLGERPAGQR